MRQAGILAACGIVSLTSMVDRLAEDHAKAKRLQEACEEIHGLSPLQAQTNILMVDTKRPATEWVERLEKNGVRCSRFAPNRIRFVTHRDVSDEEIGYAMDALSTLSGELS